MHPKQQRGVNATENEQKKQSLCCSADKLFKLSLKLLDFCALGMIMGWWDYVRINLSYNGI